MHIRVAGVMLIVASAAIVGAQLPDSRPFTRVLFLETSDARNVVYFGAPMARQAR